MQLRLRRNIFGSMERLLLTPRPPLSQFVELIWYYRNHPLPHAKERTMPDGCCSLIINLQEDETRIYDPENASVVTRSNGSGLSGPQTKCFAIDTEEQRWVLGVSFRPAGAIPFLKLPASELQNQHVELEDLWGNLGRQLRERVLEAPTPRAKLRTLEVALLERVAGMFEQQPAVQYAVEQFIGSPQTARISSIIQQTGFSPRHFIELFKHHVGLTPKLFCRVRRFQHVLRLIHQERTVNWTDVALDCGYFDQAHFIHDFRNFAGINPSKYRSDHSGYTVSQNHVPILS
jgi:AraC-like DNA-binding protein